jgi:hypothetical protein
MDGFIPDEDFISIILGSIPPSYNTYITAITAMLSLMDKTLSPTNLIDTIRDEANQCAIKNPKSKTDKQDVAFTANQSSDKGKKGGEKAKKAKKGKCFNCKKVGHSVKDCYAKGGGAKGKGLKQKSKDKEKDKKKESAAKAEEKDSEDDGVWMVTVSSDDVVQDWVNKCGKGTSCEYKMWTEEEIIASNGDLVKEGHLVEIDYSPSAMDTSNDDIFSYINDCDVSLATNGFGLDSIPDLDSILDLTKM